MPIDIELKKQPQKYLAKIDASTFNKLDKALEKLKLWQGDIVRLGNSKYYRLKIPKYRFIFTYDKGINLISIEEVNTRTNINYRRYT